MQRIGKTTKTILHIIKSAKSKKSKQILFLVKK